MFDITSNVDQVVRGLERAVIEIDKSLKRGLQEYLGDFRKEFIRKRLSGRPGVNRRSGKLARSFTVLVRGNLTRGGITADIGSDLPYARIHEEGGVIQGDNMTIPFPGVQGTIQDHPGGFFLTSKKGNLLYVNKQGDQIKPLFALEDQVRIPARLGFNRLFAEDVRDRNEALDSYIEEGLRNTFLKAGR